MRISDWSSDVCSSDLGLFEYLAWRTRHGWSPRSNARLLSALRAFFGHRVRQGQRKDDPTALLEPPKLPRSLPKALAESQVDAQIGTASCRERGCRTCKSGWLSGD